MSTGNELISGILLYLLSLVFYSRFHKLILLISSSLILFSILDLDINSYQSDLSRYADLGFISEMLDTGIDYLFYKISFLIYKFFNNGKYVILFWQFLIILNFICSENIIYNITKKLNIKYIKGLFIYTIFVSTGIYTIYNQIRYGVVYSFFVRIVLFLFNYIYTKNKLYIYGSFFLLILSSAIHLNASISFIFIPIFLFLIYKLNKWKKINLFRTKILNIPLSILVFMTFLFLFYLFNLRTIQETIPYLPVLENNIIISSTYAYLNKPIEGYITSFLYAFFNIFVGYRAIYNTRLNKFYNILNLMAFLSILSTTFLLIPLGSRLTSLYIFLPMPFYLSFNKLSFSYFFRSYYIIMALILIMRFNSIYPALV